MTVSQMTVTSTAESHQQRLHWLAEQVLNWSTLPVVHIRPTSFLDNPLFTALAARSIRENGTIALPFVPGARHQSPCTTSPGGGYRAPRPGSAHRTATTAHPTTSNA
jgi:uncharacterized protein YbjT (DUF2867 family)